MKIEQIKNDKGEILKTKDNIELKQFTFEEGDYFIPQWNSISSKKVKITKKNGEEEIVENYKLLCHVMHKDDEGQWVQVLDHNQDNPKDIFVSLTPTQAKSLQKKIDEKDEEGNRKYFITQHKFVAYSYFHEERQKNYVGVGFMPTAPKPKSFEDFEEKNKSESENE